MRAKIVSRKWTRNRVHFLAAISFQNTFCLIFRFLVQKMDTKSCPFSGHVFGPRFWFQNAQNLKSAPPFQTSVWHRFWYQFGSHFRLHFGCIFELVLSNFWQLFWTWIRTEFRIPFRTQISAQFDILTHRSAWRTTLHTIFCDHLPTRSPKLNSTTRIPDIGIIPHAYSNSKAFSEITEFILSNTCTTWNKTDSARLDVTHSATHCVT